MGTWFAASTPTRSAELSLHGRNNSRLGVWFLLCLVYEGVQGCDFVQVCHSFAELVEEYIPHR